MNENESVITSNRKNVFTDKIKRKQQRTKHKMVIRPMRAHAIYAGTFYATKKEKTTQRKSSNLIHEFTFKK
jgi:hypothetical protein